MPGQGSLPQVRIGDRFREYIAPGTQALRVLNASGNEMFRLPARSGQNFIVNEQGDDIDFRVEGDGNANLLRTDAGLFDGVGAVGVGAAATNAATLLVNPPAMTAVANTNYAKVHVDNGAAVTIPAGTTAIVAALRVDEPNITATGTVTSAVTLYIEAAPTEGGTDNLSLWVDAGATRLDGAVGIGANPEAGSTLHLTPGAVSGTPGATGAALRTTTRTFTDNATAASGTAGTFTEYAFLRPTLAATNASVTTTNAATVYIDNAPAAGTNQTISNAIALWVDAGTVRIDGSTRLNTVLYTWPSADGSNGQQLATDGSGTLSWAAAGSLRELKHVLGEVNDRADAALMRLRELRVYEFRYRRGKGTGDSEHVYRGVMADEAPEFMHFGGSILDPISTFGELVLAVQAIGRKLDRLEAAAA